MTNSIKYILQKKNLQQKMIAPKGELKQYVSRWVLGQRKIPKSVIEYWEKVLNVPAYFFVNEKGFCKELNEAEISELDEYLLGHPIHNVCDELKDSPAIIRVERGITLKRNIVKLKKNIHEDIYKIKKTIEINSIEEALDEQENSLNFYETVLRLHKRDNIKPEEWSSVFRALAYVADNTSLDDVNEGLSYEIYKLILKNREEEQKKNKELLEFRETL